MQTSLATLALHPQVTVLLLKCAKLLLALDVDFLHFFLAVIANNILMSLEQVLTSEAGLLDDRKLENARCLSALGRNVNISSMLS